MRFAIDACVPEQLAVALRALGADVTSDAGRPAMPDDEVLSGSASRDRVLITSDKDIGDHRLSRWQELGWCRADPLRYRDYRARGRNRQADSGTGK